MVETAGNDADIRDYYRAYLQDGGLVVEPFCACGRALNEDYFCDRCRRKCHCKHLYCRDLATLALVQRYISQSGQFVGFSASLETKA